MKTEHKVDLFFLTILAVGTLLLSGCAMEKRFICTGESEYSEGKWKDKQPVCHEYTQLCWFSCRGY